MEITHFSHEHPLILKEVQENEDEQKICYACKGSISEPAYSCGECKICLHKSCAELPTEIVHPMHSEHPLILIAELPRPDKQSSSLFRCRVCKEIIDTFIYNCPLCEFYICRFCTVVELIYDRECHEHLLIFQPRKVSFHCDACGKEKKDSLYTCTTCPFWIHKTCASVPSIMKHEDHSHSLTLAYRLPYEYRKFGLTCDSCNRKLDVSYWIYHCDLCKYVIHFDCMRWDQTGRANGSMSISNNDDKAEVVPREENDEDPELEPEDYIDITLPIDIASVKLIKCYMFLYHERKDFQKPTTMDHFSHDHPLVLSEVLEKDDLKDEEVICDGCIEPISAPYYYCSRCHFFLHITCTQLPTRIRDIDHHLFHDLVLVYHSGAADLFKCSRCLLPCNGFFFKCDSCDDDFRLDVTCALTPDTIYHEGHHKHAMTPIYSRHNPKDNGSCNCCGLGFNHLYKCGRCQYRLGLDCALLPRTIRHKWDEHPLSLTYQPFNEHRVEVFCEVCEEDMHPKYWMYHCGKCDKSFHPKCIPRLRHRKIKFGRTLEVGKHPHLLTLVHDGGYKSSCEQCSKNLYDQMAFKCEACKFHLCPSCASELT